MRVPKSVILSILVASGLLLVLFTTCAAQENGLAATSAADPRFADSQSIEGERFKLSPNTLQMARIIGVESEMEKLSSLAAAKEAFSRTIWAMS